MHEGKKEKMNEGKGDIYVREMGKYEIKSNRVIQKRSRRRRTNIVVKKRN